MKEAAAAVGVALPSEIYIVDVSLLDVPGDAPDIRCDKGKKGEGVR